MLRSDSRNFRDCQWSSVASLDCVWCSMPSRYGSSCGSRSMLKHYTPKKNTVRDLHGIASALEDTERSTSLLPKADSKHQCHTVSQIADNSMNNSPALYIHVFIIQNSLPDPILPTALHWTASLSQRRLKCWRAPAYWTRPATALLPLPKPPTASRRSSSYSCLLICDSRLFSGASGRFEGLFSDRFVCNFRVLGKSCRSFLEVWDLMFVQFSVNLSDKCSGKKIEA